MGNHFSADSAPREYSFGDSKEVQTSNPTTTSAKQTNEDSALREMAQQYRLVLIFFTRGCRNLKVGLRVKNGEEYLWLSFEYRGHTVEMKLRSNESIRTAIVHYLISGAVTPKVDICHPEPIADAEAWFENLKIKYRRDAYSRSAEISTDGDRMFILDALVFSKGRIVFPAQVTDDVDDYFG